MRILLVNLMRRVIAAAPCLKKAEEVEENVWFDLAFEVILTNWKSTD